MTTTFESSSKVSLVLLICMLLLSGCSGASQIGQAEVLHISQQAALTGVYAVKTGAQPFGQILQNARGTQVVLWPGAQLDGETLWNYACLAPTTSAFCSSTGEEVAHYMIGQGLTMRWTQLSRVVEMMKADGWMDVTSSIGGAAATVSSVVTEGSYIIMGFTVMPVVIPEQFTYQETRQ